ncbi:ExbD/TolR family protein [Spirochaeta dissipatitropha]
MGIKIGKPSGMRDFSGATTDISFLLIVFFLISAVFISDAGLLLRSPQEAPEPRELSIDDVLLIEIADNSDNIRLNGIDIQFRDLQESVTDAIQKRNPEAAVIQAGPEVSYGRILQSLEAARSAGVEIFSVNTADNSRAVNLGMNSRTVPVEERQQ